MKSVCWRLALRRAGLRARAPPDRHILATLALSRGEDIGWVAKMLGGTSPEMVIRQDWRRDAQTARCATFAHRHPRIVDHVFRSEGMRIRRTPVRVPRANAYAEPVGPDSPGPSVSTGCSS
jgi:hypothetical protein